MKKYYLGIATQLKSNCLDYNGKVHFDHTIKWSKGYDTMKQLMDAAAEFLSTFELKDNQHIIIERR